MKRNIKSVFTAILMMFAVIFASYSTVDAETVTDGNVKIDIPEYNSSVGWKVGDVYTATITVNFEDNTTTDKIAKIKLPMGMRYVSYPAKNPATSGNLKNIEQGTTGAFDSVLDSSTSAIAPVFSQYSYYDEIIYNFKSTCESQEIKILLTVDEYLYYGTKTFNADNGIIVTASKNGVADLGTVKMGLKAIDDGINYQMIGTAGEKTFLEGSTEQITVQNLGMYRYGTDILYFSKLHPKKATLKYYYPKGEGIKFESAFVKSGGRIIDHPTEAYLEVVYEDASFGSLVGDGAHLTEVKLSFENAAVGQYKNLTDGVTNKHEIILTAYDDTVINVNANYYNVSSTLNIVDSSQISKNLNLTSKNGEYKKISSDFLSAITYKIMNDNLTEKSNFIFEFEAGTNMEVEELVLPTTVKSFKYKTNLNNSNWINLDISELTKTNSPHNKLLTFNVKKMGLENGEYLTNAIAELDDIKKGFDSGGGYNLYYTYQTPRVLSRLKNGINTDSLQIKTYQIDSDKKIIDDTLSVINPTLTRTATLNSNGEFSLNATNVNAGGKELVNGYISINGYFYQNAVAMVNPAIYIKLPKGVNIDKDSVKVTSTYVSNSIDYVVSDPYTLSNGDRYIEIDIKQFLGGYFDGGQANVSMKFSFEIQTSLLSSGNYKWSDYAFLMDKSNEVNVGTVVDTYDIDRDNNTTEKMVPSAVSNYIIQEKKELLIDTYIKASATDPREADYDTSKPASAINFTPGTEAIYTVDIYNNRNDSVGTKANTTAYIPVPKKGLNFGNDFQQQKGYWNMKLGNALPVIKVYDVDPLTGVETDVTASKASNYKLEYSSDATATNYDTTAIYNSASSATTNMIRVTNTAGIEMQEKAVIEFVYVVDEDSQSVIDDPTKLGKINDFRPYYRFVSEGTSGWAEGTRVGANLVIGEISGLAFKDMNKDGIYTDGTDAIFPNQTIKLYKHDGTSYVAYTYPGESTPAEVTTGTDGKYKFSNLPNGDYKIDFKTLSSASGIEFTPIKIGNDFKVDSDVEVSGTDAGMALGIDPTKEASKYIYAGVIKYNPPVDLIMTFDDGTDVDKSITVLGQLDGSGVGEISTIKMKLEPDFFETIADKTYDSDGMKAESSNSAKATAEWTGSLVDKGDYLETSATITGVASGSSVVTFSIKDVYGTTRSLKVNVTVNPNSRPVISASDTTVEAGDTTFNLASLASITDAEDGSSTPATVGIKSNGGFNVNTVGTYTVVYKSLTTDNDGNLALDKTITVSVVDTTKPVTTITPSPSGADVNPTAITVSGTDNATGTLTHSWIVEDSGGTQISSGSGADVTIPSADGTYVVKATSTDAASNVSDEVSFTFIINSSTPEVAIVITPTSKHNPTEIKVNATDGTDPSPTVSYTIKNSSNTIVDSQSNVASGATASIPTTDGVYTITAKAKNNASAESSEISDTFTIDKTAPLPVITITPVSKVNPTSVVVSASDAIDTNPKLSYEIKDSSNTVVKDGSNVASGSSATLPTADGVYTIEVVAVDASSNTSTKVSDTFTIDKTAPDVSVVITPTSKVNPTEIKFEADDVLDSDPKITYTIKDSDNSVVDSQSNVSSGATASIPTTDGVYTISYKAIDKHGNETTSKNTSFTIDTVAPSVSVAIKPTNKYNPTEIKFSASDALDSNPKISYEIKDGSNTVVDSGVDVVSGTTASIPSADGVYTISYTASDKHGNTSVVQTETFTVDKTAPVLTTTDTTKDVKIGTSGTIDYKTLFGLSASDVIDATIDASKVNVDSNAVNVNKTGSYTVTFSVSDAAGNTQTKDVTIRIVALSVSGLVFEDKDYSSTNNAGDGAISGVTIQLINADDDSVITSTTTQADGTYTMNMPNGSESVTNYAIKAVDPVGYIVAKQNISSTPAVDSCVDTTTRKSASMTLSGSDYIDLNIGYGADAIIGVSPLTQKVYVGDTVSSNITLTNATVDSINLNNSNASYSSTANGVDITGVSAGTTKVTITFKNGYNDYSTTKEIDVTVLALPTIDGVDYKTQIGKKVTIEPTYTPVDGILSYVSSNSSIVSVDATGEASAKSRGTSIVSAKVTTNDTQAKEATKKILVSVGLENDPVVGTKDAIDAVDFYMSYEQAKNRTKEKMIGYANAEAWSIEEATLNDDVAITDVDDSAIDMSKLKTKSSVSAKATKTFPVTFTSANGTKVTVDATIADVNTVLNTKDGEAIEAYDFKIKDSDVKGLDKSKVISLAKGKAWNLSDKSKVAITKVNYSKIQAKKGVYPVTLATKKGTSIKVYAKVLETETPITGTNELTIAVSIMGIVSLLGLAKFKLREE